jgi:hypothetical protein
MKFINTDEREINKFMENMGNIQLEDPNAVMKRILFLLSKDEKSFNIFKDILKNFLLIVESDRAALIFPFVSKVFYNGKIFFISYFVLYLFLFYFSFIFYFYIISFSII